MSQCHVGRRGGDNELLAYVLGLFFLLRLKAGSGLGVLFSDIYPWNGSPCQERDDKAKFMQSTYDILKYIDDFYNDSKFIEFLRDSGIS